MAGFKLVIFVFFLAFQANESRNLPAFRQAKLSLVDWNNYSTRDQDGPGTYAFGYDIEDPETNNVQTRTEERYPNGTVVGSYGYVQADGTLFLVHYIADEKGYRATIETNPRKYFITPAETLSNIKKSYETTTKESTGSNNDVY